MIPQFDEPTSAEAVAEWVRNQTQLHDRFRAVYLESEAHRQGHEGCQLYPSSNGPLLGVLAAAVAPTRVVDVGGGLGYSALHLAHGAGPQARVDSIEYDESHVAAARKIISRSKDGASVEMHLGRASDVLPGLDAAYDMIFCDADPDDYNACYREFLRLLRVGGLVITSNLFLAQYDAGIPGLDQASDFRQRLLDEPGWLTSFLSGGLALSVRVRE